MIVLSEDPDEPPRLAQGAPNLQRRYGMPIDPNPYPRPASSMPACRAVIAARLHAPEREDALLRALRVRTMAGGLLDAPELLAAAAGDADLDWRAVEKWAATEPVERALAADIAAARAPNRAARALDHKLGGPPNERRYPAPTYVMTNADQKTFTVPGFNPVEAYEAAIAHLAPKLERRPTPNNVADVLAWAGMAVATAEVALIAQLDRTAARNALGRVAVPHAVGAEFYWTLA